MSALFVSYLTILMLSCFGANGYVFGGPFGLPFGGGMGLMGLGGLGFGGLGLGLGGYSGIFGLF